MNWKRTATLGVSGGTVVALLATASTPIVREPAASSPLVAPQEERGDAVVVAVDTERLRTRTTDDSQERTRRNLFAFAPSSPVSEPEPRAVEARGSSGDALPPERPPSWQLIGIAADRDPQSDRRTAILSGAGRLQFVTAGEMLSDGLRVVAVGDESIELRADQGRSIVLTLSR